VNDVHSRLNHTLVRRIERPRTVPELCHLVRSTARRAEPLSVAGGRHAMGGQQFASGGVLVDATGLDRVLGLDVARGTIEVEAGIQWPALVRWLLAAQGGAPGTWTIRQKQTGADSLSLGGALAANVHGRCLDSAPMIADVEAFTLVGPTGEVRRCSRTQNAELFRAAIGGYGLLGIIATVTLRLARRKKLVRLVRELDSEHAVDSLEDAAREGAKFGDFQLAIDDRSPDFLQRGILSVYHPVSDRTPMGEEPHTIGEADWRRLLHLAHFHKSRGYAEYRDHYLSTSGQLYWSDLHQLGLYVDGYHDAIDECSGTRGSEMISELYVPRRELAHFLARARTCLRAHAADVIYATLRLIERDTESLVSWAREPWACLVFNLHTEHSPAALERSADAFRALIDVALGLGGTYYLTYHRWAAREQVLAGHPGLPRLMDAKRRHDPDERFQSDWYRHHRDLLNA
jgi:FAD/FMN-containing dehydrogenase